uniref:Ig-like domain-containing protein n=1 Tax=Elaeophora elaphi TaxID=1147741 RepID=A0A158Q7E8_9BILA
MRNETRSLQSVGYASLRIDEMQPRMLELGENADETNALLAIHEDLMYRLKNKEDQVEELLARADNLVIEQKEPDVHVYEAMAESLGTAWKELNRQLHMRGFLLIETKRFYELARRHEEISSKLRNMLCLTIQRSDADNLNYTMVQIQQLIDELIDVTASAVDSGADVITQIRVLGSMADNVESVQETARACLLIEKTMLKMAAEWELIEESWKNERSKLEMQIDESGAVLSHIEEIEKWLQQARMQLSDGQNINALMQQVLKQNKALKDIISTVDRSGANTSLHERVMSLQTDLETFMQELKRRKDENDKVIAWIAAANTMLNQLGAMETDMRNANAAMAGELAPLARQKAQKVIDDGRQIDHIDRRVDRFITDIQNKLKQIENLANERIDESQELIKDQLYRFEKWLGGSEQSFTVNSRLGSNLNDAIKFHKIHKDMFIDIINKGFELNSLWSKSHELGSVDHQRLEEFKQRYESLKEAVDERVNLGTAFQQVQKFAKELEGSFESLNALISSNRTYMNEKLLTKMKEVFRMIEETIKQEKYQGNQFIETAQSAKIKDSKLDIEQSINAVRNLLNEHEQRLRVIDQTWQRWQDKRVEEEKIIRIVEEVQIWQEETVEIIRTAEIKLESAKMIEEREEVVKIIEEIEERFHEQERRIEEAERILKETEGKCSSSEEAFEKVMTAKKRQKQIEEQLTQLKERIRIVEERINETSMETTKAPEITSHLRDAQIEEGNRFEFTAYIKGEPVPEIRWFKDGRDVKDNIDYRTAFVNGVATLTIDETFVEDTAVYTVRAQNVAGLAESSAKLVVKSRSELGRQADESFKPRFIRQLRNITITEGDDAFLDCIIVAVPEPKVVWYKDEEAIKESEHIELQFEGDHCSLKAKNANMSDAGLYTVKATNNVGEATNFCRLTVQPAPASRSSVIPPSTSLEPKFSLITPSFAPPLTNQVVREGARTVFEVRVFGEPPPTVQWKHNDKPLYTTLDTRTESDINGWYRVVIENTLPQHSGMYTVVAKNKAGEARSGATLNVESRRISMEQKETSVVQAMTEGFWSDSAIMSSPTPPPVPKHRYHSEIEEYAEKLVSEIGCSPTATVPEFIRPFQNEYVVSEGEKFKMDCLMIGNPRPKVRWYFNNQIININSKFCTLSNIGDTYSAILEPARLDHAGVYKMTAENIRGETESVFVVRVIPRSLKPSTIEHVHVTEEYGAYEYEQRIPDEHFLQQFEYVNDNLRMREDEQRRLIAKQHATRLLSPPPAKKQQLQTIHSQQNLSERYDTEESRELGRPPHFTQTLVSAVAACGDETKFQGIVIGWPTPEVTWTKDGIPISKATNPELTFSNIGGHVSLTFPTSQLEHSGKYMCTAKNTSGVATSSAQLVVRPRTVAPDFVRRLISEEVAEGDELKWTVQVTGDPTPTISWMRNGMVIPHCDEVRLVDEGNGVHSMIIIKVEMADSGQFTCLAENIAGEARSTADLVIRPAGSEPGSYFHVTKVTQEKKVKGEEVNRNESFAIENPRTSIG